MPPWLTAGHLHAALLAAGHLHAALLAAGHLHAAVLGRRPSVCGPASPPAIYMPRCFAPAHLHASPSGRCREAHPFKNATVTPSPPSLCSPGRNVSIALCDPR